MAGSTFLSSCVVSNERMNSSMSFSIPAGGFMDGP